MQLLGLGAIAVLLPLSLWGWRLARIGNLGRGQLRIALWIIGSGAATAVASALPTTDRWPLPTGLGGVSGDALLAGAKAVTGLSNGPASALLGFVFAGIAILSLTASCGFGFSEDPPWSDASYAQERCRVGGAGRGRHDEPGWGIVSLGAIAHGFMSLRAALRRWLAARRVRR